MNTLAATVAPAAPELAALKAHLEEALAEKEALFDIVATQQALLVRQQDILVLQLRRGEEHDDAIREIHADISRIEDADAAVGLGETRH